MTALTNTTTRELVIVRSYRFGDRSDCQSYVDTTTAHVSTCHHVQRVTSRNKVRGNVWTVAPEEIAATLAGRSVGSGFDRRICSVCRPDRVFRPTEWSSEDLTRLEMHRNELERLDNELERLDEARRATLEARDRESKRKTELIDRYGSAPPA